MNTNSTIRSMRLEDLPRVVEIHMQTYLESRATNILGEPFLRKEYRWFLTYQPDLCFVAILDEQIVGFVTGAIGGSSRKIFRYALPEVIAAFIRHPRRFIQANMFEHWRSYLFGFLLNKKDRSNAQAVYGTGPYIKATLDSIAVVPDARGKKIGQTLVSAFEESAKKRGATILGLGVWSNNTSARRTYEHCGWRLASENLEKKCGVYIKEVE